MMAMRRLKTLALSTTLLAMVGCDLFGGPGHIGEVVPPEEPTPHPLPPTPPIGPDGEALTGFPHELPARPRAIQGNPAKPWMSGRALAYHGDRLFVVDADNEELVVVVIPTEKIERRIKFDTFGPSQVAVAPDGTAFVTLRHGYSVARVAPGTTYYTTQLVGAEPVGIALSEDGEHVFATVAGEDAVVALDAATLQLETRVDTIRRPRTLALTADGGTLVVGGLAALTQSFHVSHVGESTQLSSNTTAPLRTTQPADQTLHFGRSQLVRSNRARGCVAHPEVDGAVLVVHEQAMPGTPEDSIFGNIPEELQEEIFQAPSDGGYGGGASGIAVSAAPHIMRPIEASVTVAGAAAIEPGFPVKDPETGRPLTQQLAQPTDINHHPTMTMVFVTGHGSDNVLVLNTADADPMRSPLAIIDVGQAPRAIVFDDDGSTAYVLSSQSFQIDVIDVAPLMNMQPSELEAGDAFDFDALMPPVAGKGVLVDPLRLKSADSFPYGLDPLPFDMRLGRRTYTFVENPRISRDNQFACASCHFDGYQDDLAWFVPGGPRQTPQLAGRLQGTGPFNWLGTEDQLQSNMVETIHRMGGEGLEQAELVSLEKFLLKGLRRPVNPNVLGPLTAAQKRGQAIFEDPQVGCAVCHTKTTGTDGQLHDVGTANDVEFEAAAMAAELSGTGDFEPPKINTPTLKDLFATAPYLHDGSATTLREVLDRTATTMGNTWMLSDSEKDDLVAYLLTL